MAERPLKHPAAIGISEFAPRQCFHGRLVPPCAQLFQ